MAPPRKNAKSQSQIAEEIRAKADKAAARAAKAPKADTVKADTVKADASKTDATSEKPAKPPKPDKNAPRASNDDQDRALFLHNLPKIGKLIADKDAAVAALRNAYKQAKADGFAKADFDEAFKMQGHEGEKVKKDAIKRSLRIARWLGMDLGAQLDMFEQDARVPAVDRAYEEGKSQAMQGISLKCDYAQETEQYRTFAAGWHHGQAILSKGFKQLHPEVAEDEKQKLIKKQEREAAQAKDAAAFDAPASGVAMTREEYKRQQEQQQGKPN
ncbi:MAG TPA: hypothetical protein VN181_10765 [Thermoanaerobaculia bacterium]|nr:hypothetical protein [Thermoanaerobaculia bacterium]